LSIARAYLAAVTAAEFTLFAGGYDNVGPKSKLQQTDEIFNSLEFKFRALSDHANAPIQFHLHCFAIACRLSSARVRLLFRNENLNFSG
jgi:hypothetical protein